MMPPYQVRTFGYIHKDPTHASTGTRQGDVMLCLFLDGKGYYASGGSVSELNQGTVTLIFDEEPGLIYADKENPYTHIFCRFSGDFAKQQALEIYSREGEIFRVPEIERYSHYFNEIEWIHQPRLPDRMGPREVALAQVLTALQSQDEAPKRTTLDASTFASYMQQNFKKPIHLDTIAEDFGLSKSSLCRIVPQLTGMTVVQAFETARIEKAKELLESGVFNISETGQRVGYEDPYYFSKVFKKHTGRSPKIWLNSRAECP